MGGSGVLSRGIRPRCDASEVFAPPSTLNEALAAIDGLLESETLRVLTPGQRYPALFSGAVREGDARGNLAFDAQIVAVCREQGASRLLTLDRDFSRFAGIEIEGLESLDSAGDSSSRGVSRQRQFE